MKNTELIALVELLNNAAYQQAEGSQCLTPFTYLTDGDEHYIRFLDRIAWSSIDDPMGEDIKRHISSFLEAVARLAVPALVALLPETGGRADGSGNTP